MSSSKFTTVILSTIIILFAILFSLFFLYVYEDYKKTEAVTEFVDISERKGEIKPVTISENTEETKILEIEPVAVPVQNDKDAEESDNKFYYSQLDGYSKLIYESIEEQKEKLKTGNSKIKLPDKIGEVLEKENAEDNIKAIFTIAINAFEYDNPDIFYVDASKLILFYERDAFGNYNIYLKNSEQDNSYLLDGFNNEKDVEQAQNQIDFTVQEIRNEIEKLNNNYNKILYIHDWLVDNIKYDETLSKTNRNNIYGAFVKKEVTCGGYAKAFKYLVDELNINCIIIQGEATSENGTENHAWNYIELNNKWYGIDCTWDDPIIIGGNTDTPRKTYHTYYLKGQNVFNNDHKPFETFLGTDLKLNYPELSIDNCDY